jgi:hypothetical protein
MRVRDLVFVGVLLGAAGALAAGVLRPAARAVPASRDEGSGERSRADLDAVIARVDATLRRSWAGEGRRPAPLADELTLIRRLALALTGSIPSLEEIRRFEALPAGGRVDAWLDALLRDRRTADYLAERFARAAVGTEDGPFLLFRRRRFTTWLSDALLANRPYSAIVRDLIADRGLWTDHPATNFVTVTFDPETGRPDPERLAARVSRCFLGVRLDCARCHDHPFQPWKQADFRGLAAFFGGVHSDLRGTRDGARDYRPPARTTKEPTEVDPRVPFRTDLLPGEGSPRDRLAAWVVDPRNTNLARATVNRVWALILGRPLSEPVDDLPAEDDQPEVLSELAADFADHGSNLHRLIRVIAGTTAFRRASAVPDGDGPTHEDEAAWAAFPLTRLRPEQVAGAVFQCASLATIGPQSSWIVRLAAFTGRNDFVRRYGDTGEDEFTVQGGTIPQRLLLMNGDLVRAKTKRDLFNAATRIAQQAPDDPRAIEVAYLAVLTRRPTPEESAYFTAKLAGTAGAAREDGLTDLYWALLNSTEFSWNH